MTFKNDIISSGYMQLYRDWWSQAALLSWNDGSRRIDLYWFWSWTVKPLRFIILHTITEQLPPNICALFLFCLRLRHKCYIIYAKLHPWPVRHDLGGIYDHFSVYTWYTVLQIKHHHDNTWHATLIQIYAVCCCLLISFIFKTCNCALQTLLALTDCL